MKDLFTQQAESNQTTAADAQSQATGSSSVEQEIEQIVGGAATIASPFIKSTPATAAFSAALSFAPEVIHLGVLFASIFRHPTVQAAIVAAANATAPAAPVVAAPVVAPAPTAAQIAAAARAAQIADLQKQLADLQSVQS
jgi:hypothetical protein